MKQPGYILPSNVGLVQVVCVWGGGGYMALAYKLVVVEYSWDRGGYKVCI